MYGKGIAKGMMVTFKRFAGAFMDDIRYAGRRYLTGGQELSGDLLLQRQGPRARGAFTVQYPFEKLPVPENFRYIPFLLYDTEAGKHLCTACGICARVCPPQCIWVERATDPETGRPKKEPASFYIDAGICMSCGLCAEVCNFDSIKMGHDYEIAVYDRAELLYDLEKLTRPVSYHAEIHPRAWEAEEKARAEKAAKKKK
ncbi:MAG: 4Fe-4S dicluster domain-containing protein [Anaerolineae bacterium]|jgi:NADH-quinone oxidoreductase subunit I